MIYTIINPSDHYTLEAHSLDVAAIVCIVLGGGQYSLEAEDGGEGVPFFMFGGADEWGKEKFGKPIDEVFQDIKTNRIEEFTECFDSVVIGNREDYYAGLAAVNPEKRIEYRDKWLDEHRSSMNNIGKRAYKTAEAYRNSGTIEKAPQQVFSI